MDGSPWEDLKSKSYASLLFSELLACLGGLANLLADHLPLVVLVVFDCLEQRSTEAADLIFSKVGVVHILVPMFLHAPFCSRWKSFGDLAPATARLPQRLQPLLFGRSPWCVCSALFRHRAR